MKIKTRVLGQLRKNLEIKAGSILQTNRQMSKCQTDQRFTYKIKNHKRSRQKNMRMYLKLWIKFRHYKISEQYIWFSLGQKTNHKTLISVTYKEVLYFKDNKIEKNMKQQFQKAARRMKHWWTKNLNINNNDLRGGNRTSQITHKAQVGGRNQAFALGGQQELKLTFIRFILRFNGNYQNNRNKTSKSWGQRYGTNWEKSVI